MKRPFTISNLMLAAALVLVPATLSAQLAPSAPGLGGGPRGPGEDPGEFFLQRMAEELELSEGQIVEIEALMSNHRVDTAELHAQARPAYEALRSLTNDEVFDEAAVRAAAQKAAAIRIELAVERARLRSAINEVLTPEQREEAAQIRARREERWQEFREGRGERRGRGPRGRAPRGRRG